ncbi:MAG: helix-turn-helix domain-containing protein [bacterium]
MPSKPATPNIDAPPEGSKPAGGLLSVKEAADYLRMSEGWLYGSGIPCVHLGRRRLYRRADLDAAIEQNRSHGTQGGDK